MIHHPGSSLSFGRRRRAPVPALPPYLIEPIWQQLVALLPERHTSHPLGCHRPRIPDRIVFEKLIQVLVFGCACKRGVKRSVAVDGRGIPLGCVSAPANLHDSQLLVPTLDAARAIGPVAQDASVHLDRGYDSDLTRERLLERGLVAQISEKGRPAPLNATGRWVVERTNSWQNAHKKLVWCTERRGRVVDFWVALSEVVIIVRRLVREGWMRYRWEARPSRRP
jgi:Transposase DDE domain